MRALLPVLLLACAEIAPAAVSLDVDVAALRNVPDSVAVRAAAAQKPFFPRLAAGAAAVQARTGNDPRLTVRRVQVSIGDDGGIGVVVVGPVAATLAERVAGFASGAKTSILADDTLAIGLAGASPPAAPFANLAAPGTPIALHATPRPQPLLAIMARVRWLDLHDDGAGHIRVRIQAQDHVGASEIMERITALRDHPPLLMRRALPAEAAPVLAGMQVALDDYAGDAVEVALDAPLAARIACLRAVSERIQAKFAQVP